MSKTSTIANKSSQRTGERLLTPEFIEIIKRLKGREPELDAVLEAAELSDTKLDPLEIETVPQTEREGKDEEGS